jgi:signal transduction histidine kinase
MLEFTRQRRIERRSHDPAALVRSVIEIVASDQAVAGVSLRVDDGWGDRGTMLFDGAQLKQVLLNLLRNAVEAAAESHPGAGLVVATVGMAPEGLAITVDDDGPGVPPDARQLIFTPFHTTKEHGTGLGLAVSFAIVQLHGGTLTVEDGPLGGARFRVVIPAG